MTIFIACLSPVLAAAETFTLEEALDTALQHSLAVEQADVERSQGKQALAEGVASALPDLSASYSTSGDTVGELGDTWRFNFGLTQPVVDAAVIFDVVRGVREKDYYRSKSARTVADLVLNVENGYYDLARAQALVGSAEGQQRRAAANSNTVARRYELGEANLADKLRAEADLLTKEAELLSARNGVEEKRRALSDVVGLERWEELEVEELPAPEDPASLPTTLISAAALEENPDLEVLRMQVKASEISYWAAWGSILPALSFSLSRGTTYGDTAAYPEQGDSDTRYSVVVSIPVVDVTRWPLDVNRARLDRKQSRLELAQAELQARERLANVLAEQELSYREWETAVKTVELNEEVYRLNKRSYELGAVSFDELLQVEADLTEAERSLVQSRADYWSSRAELNYLLGTSVEE